MGLFKRKNIWYIDYFFQGNRIKRAIGPKKKEAEAKLGKIRAEIREGKHFEKKKEFHAKFDELVTVYENRAKEKKGYIAEKYYIRMIEKYFSGWIVAEISPLDIEKFRQSRKDALGPHKQPRSGTAINHELRCLRAMLYMAVKWGYAEKNPAARIELFPEPQGRNKFLSVEESERLLGACYPHLRPIVLCALETGMRKSEILGLRWEEIRNGMIYLPGERTKNGKPREIFISPRLSEELKKIRREQMQEGASTNVFRAHRGRPSEDGTRRLKVLTMAVKSFREAWKAAKEKAGIDPSFHFHDLRHTYASHQKMAGTDDYTLMELMGHSDFKMMKRYAHLTPEHKQKAVERLAEWREKESTCPKSVPNEQEEGKGPEGQYPPALVFAGAEGGI